MHARPLTSHSIQVSAPSNEPNALTNLITSYADSHSDETPQFRLKSLLLASFPWHTSLPMVPIPIAEELGDAHYGFVRL